MRRHELIHKDSTARHALSEGGRLRRGSVVRACRRCAASKQRCDGKSPCERCTSKGLTCSYPSATQSKTRSVVAQRVSGDKCSVSLSTGLGGSPAAGETSAFGQLHDAESHVFPTQAQKSSYTQTCVPPAVPLDTDFSEGSLSTAFDPAQLDMSVSQCGVDGNKPQPSAVTDSTWLHQPSASSSIVYGAVPMEYNPARSGSLWHGCDVKDLPISDKARTSRTGPVYDLLAPRCPRKIQLESPEDLAVLRKEGENLGDVRTWMFEDYGHVPRLPSEAYQAIKNWFEKVNCDGDLFQRFTDEALPSLDVMNSFMQVYFEEFHPVFPLLHGPSFVPSEANWILVLAVATIGCRFSHALACRHISKSLDELLRRAVVVAVRIT